MDYTEITLTKQQAKDLKIQGRIYKLRPGYALVNTTEGWKVIRL